MVLCPGYYLKFNWETEQHKPKNSTHFFDVTTGFFFSLNFNGKTIFCHFVAFEDEVRCGGGTWQSFLQKLQIPQTKLKQLLGFLSMKCSCFKVKVVKFCTKMFLNCIIFRDKCQVGARFWLEMGMIARKGNDQIFSDCLNAKYILHFQPYYQNLKLLSCFSLQWSHELVWTLHQIQQTRSSQVFHVDQKLIG